MPHDEARSFALLKKKKEKKKEKERKKADQRKIQNLRAWRHTN
jgi:hypothetical protein